jgi:hypothetical protein
MRHRSLQSGTQFRPGLSFGESVPPLSEGNDQKRRAPVNCSTIRTGGLEPINARTSRLGQLMIPLTCLAQAHLVNPKTGKLGSGDEWMRGVLRVYTMRAEVMRSPWPLSAFFEVRGRGRKSQVSPGRRPHSIRRAAHGRSITQTSATDNHELRTGAGFRCC